MFHLLRNSCPWIHPFSIEYAHNFVVLFPLPLLDQILCGYLILDIPSIILTRVNRTPFAANGDCGYLDIITSRNQVKFFKLDMKDSQYRMFKLFMDHFNALSLGSVTIGGKWDNDGFLPLICDPSILF